MRKVIFEYYVESLEIDLDSIEEELIKKLILQCISLCQKGEHEKASRITRNLLTFFFDPRRSDIDGSEIFCDALGSEVELNNQNCKIHVSTGKWFSSTDDKYIDAYTITANIKFVAMVHNGVSENRIEKWLDEEAGKYSADLQGDWEYSGDGGWYLAVRSCGLPFLEFNNDSVTEQARMIA